MVQSTGSLAQRRRGSEQNFMFTVSSTSDKIGRSVRNMPSPRAISLFSGCGGSDYALQKLGYDIVWANDVWQTACDTYKENIRDSNI
jgi:hypothetical protein